MFSGRLTRGKRESLQEPVINMTPLIDVVFVLLISFIIVAPLLEKDSVELASSGPSRNHPSAASQEHSPISIYVLQDNRIVIRRRTIPQDALLSVILELKRRYPEAKPQLFHDRRAAFGTYQSIKNCLETAGFSELDILLQPS